MGDLEYWTLWHSKKNETTVILSLISVKYEYRLCAEYSSDLLKPLEDSAKLKYQNSKF